MSDPFGDPAAANVPPQNASIREPFVRQAVSFLSDKRVQTADPSKALTFLRQKGVSEDELREAYRRVGIPFPSSHVDMPSQQTALAYPTNYQHATQYPLQAAQFANYPPPAQRTSWFNVFLGLTAAAGLYTAVREVLKRYIVPMYFPDAARIAEERRRREDQASEIQGRQIAELRTCVRELLETSQKTNEKVDQMSQSMSSTIALHEREISQTSELRDAIRQLSHSVTVSAGTETSREIRNPMSTEGGASSAAKIGMYGHKLGSLAYSHVDHFDGTGSLKAEGSQGDVFSTPVSKTDVIGTMVEKEKSSENVYLGKSVARMVDTFEKNGEENDDNDFMAIAPAQVDDSWVAANAMRSKTAAVGQTAEAEGIDENGAEVNTARNEDMKQDESGSAAQAEAKSMMETSGLVEDEIAEVVVTGDAGSTTAAENIVDEVITSAVEEESSKAMARQMFQNAIMKEAQQVLSQSSNSGSSSQHRARPLSMPPMDLPLSDSEFY